MNFPFFIARKVAASGRRSFARLIIYIAISAVALSISVMIIATSMINGFKSEISTKMFGFWGHIHITNTATNTTLEPKPISLDSPYIHSLATLQGISYDDHGQTIHSFGGIRHVQSYAIKPGIITTKRAKDDDSKKNFEGIILKGVGKDYDWTFINQHLVDGKAIQFSTDSSNLSKDVMISQTTADRLLLKTGDKFIVHFVQGNEQQQRVFRICGIYKTGLEEYDKRYAIVDIAQVQDLLGWQPNQATGLEVFVDDLRDLDPINQYVYKEIIPNDAFASTVRDEQPAIFQWLDLQDINEKIILGMMVVVSIINMVTALLILILERANMIGTLKALGARDWGIQSIFLYYGAIIASIGLLFGNVIGLGLCWLQKTFGFIRLSEADYYLSVAPIKISFWTILALNIGTLFVTVIFLTLPSFLAKTITPVKAMRFK